MRARNPRLAPVAWICFTLLLVAACSGDPAPVTVLDVDPLFTDPVVKLEATADPAFTQTLWEEAKRLEPLLATAGTQVHMGLWSASGNHGALVKLLDAYGMSAPFTNGTTPPFPTGTATYTAAIWDEGVTTSIQYPSYVRMNHEHWYERSSPYQGTIYIYRVPYQDPFPVTPEQADDIWGQYSARYVDMASLIYQATGKTVKVWAYTFGGRACRVFYKYELPELQKLEPTGAVQVFVARSVTSDWTVTGDWYLGTANAPAAVPCQ